MLISQSWSLHNGNYEKLTGIQNYVESQLNEIPKWMKFLLEIFIKVIYEISCHKFTLTFV